jgi:hypothetical protein
MGTLELGPWVQSGRVFSPEEIAAIRTTVRWLPGLARKELKACRVSLVNPSGCSCSRTDSLLGDNLVWPRYALLRAAAAPRRAPDGAVGLRHRPTQMA